MRSVQPKTSWTGSRRKSDPDSKSTSSSSVAEFRREGAGRVDQDGGALGDAGRGQDGRSLLGVQAVPPDGHRLGVVGAGRRDRVGRVIGRVAVRLALRLPIALPAEHPVAGDVLPGERLADEIGDRAQVFGDDARTRLRRRSPGPFRPAQAGPLRRAAKTTRGRHRSGTRRCGRSRRGGRRGSRRTAMRCGARGRAARRSRSPRGLPPVGRHPPVLPGLAEGVRRRADRGVEAERLDVGPDIGAVAVHHEGEVAHQGDGLRTRLRVVPLAVGDPLQPHAIEDLVRQRRAGVRQRPRFPHTQRLGPLHPGAVPVVFVQRAEQRVVVDPPGLFLAPGMKRLGPLGTRLFVAALELVEGGPEGGPLHAAHERVVDRRRPPRGCQLLAPVRGHGRLAADRLELGHRVDADEDRVDRHGRERRVRRPLAHGHLVDRQQLQQVLAGLAEPRREDRDVADFPDPPAVARGHREQRDEQARVPSGG